MFCGFLFPDRPPEAATGKTGGGGEALEVKK